MSKTTQSKNPKRIVKKQLKQKPRIFTNNYTQPNPIKSSMMMIKIYQKLISSTSGIHYMNNKRPSKEDQIGASVEKNNYLRIE